MKYRKKPMVVDAWLFDGTYETACAFQEMCAASSLSFSGNSDFEDFSLYIDTLIGKMKCAPGDYLVRGVLGEFYPCKPHIFEATYEKAEE